MEQDTANSGGAFVPAPLEDILSREPETDAAQSGGQPESVTHHEPDAETGEAAQATPEQTDDTPRDERGRFAPKAPEQPSAEAGPPPVANEPKSVPLSAVLEERKKRQALEAELAAFRAQAQPQQPAQQPPPQVPLEELVFQDPKQFVQLLARQQEEALLQTRIATSEVIARQQPDYPEAEAAVEAYANSDPRLRAAVAQMLRSHPAPAIKALEFGRELLAQRPEAIEARINAEVERRLAEPQAAPASSSAPSMRLPGSLADVRSAGPRASAQAQTFTPLESIARFKG